MKLQFRKCDVTDFPESENRTLYAYYPDNYYSVLRPLKNNYNTDIRNELSKIFRSIRFKKQEILIEYVEPIHSKRGIFYFEDIADEAHFLVWASNGIEI
jgi:hypothetical protein